MEANRCVCCGEIITEDRQVCHSCEMKYSNKNDNIQPLKNKLNIYKLIICGLMVLLFASIMLNVNLLYNHKEKNIVESTVCLKESEKIQHLSVGINTPEDGHYELMTNAVIHYDEDNEISWIEINNPVLLAFKVSDNYDGGVALVEGKEVQEIINDIKSAISNLDENDTVTKNILKNLLSRIEDFGILVQAST